MVPGGRGQAIYHTARLGLLAAAVATLALSGCGAGSPVDSDQPTASLQQPFSVGGCSCPQSGSCSSVSYTDIPSDSRYYITTFTGGGMACGGTADGTWAYIADSGRFGCGAHVLMQANGKQCVAQVADCGPNRCVEDAAGYSGCGSHHPIIDASPFITEHLFGISGSGWSERRVVKAQLVSSNTAIGCPGGAPPPKTLKAKAVRKWSDAKRYHGGAADYLACTGDKVKLGFTFKNVGTAEWRDDKGRGKKVGSDVFLVTASGKRDRITGRRHFSVRLDRNHHVRGDRKAPNCSNRNGCRKTTFIAGGMVGRAPRHPGIYVSRWRLRDYSKAWHKHSHGFGPKVHIKLKVIDCNVPAGECGCHVVCSDGRSRQLSSSIHSDAACRSAAQTFCRPKDGQGSLFIYNYSACQEPGSGGAPGSSTASAGDGGASANSGAGGAANGSGSAGTSGAGGAADGPGSASASGASGGGGAAGSPGSAGASGAAPTVDPGSDPNGIDIPDNGDDSSVTDDPGFSDYGFNGDDDNTGAGATAAKGCSVAQTGGRSGTPLELGALMLLFGLACSRRRARHG